MLTNSSNPLNTTPPFQIVESQDADAPELLTMQEAAKLLRKGRRFVRKEIDGGRLRAVPLGKRDYIPRNELQAYLRRRMQAHTKRRDLPRNEDGTFTKGGPTPLFSE